MIEKPNLNYIESIADGDKDFMDKLIDVIRTELPLEIKQYYDCSKKNKLKETAEIVHKIKHKISILGLEKSYIIAENYENSLKILTPDNTLQLKFETTLRLMSDFIARL